MRFLLLLAALGLLTGCVVVGVVPIRTGRVRPLVRPVVATTGGPTAALDAMVQRLPAEAAGFMKGQTLPLRQSAPGVEVTYATPGRIAAGFVQVVRVPDGSPPDGSESPVVGSEFQRAVEEAVRDAGPNRRLTVVQEMRQPATDPLFRCAVLEGTYGRQPGRSIVCVGALSGQLLRLGASTLDAASAQSSLQAFARDVAVAMRR